MSKELNCTNCSIGDFKHELCDCDNGFCKEFKSIGNQEDFFNAVMQRIRPQGKWVKSEIPNELYVCSECGGACWSYDYERNIVKSNYCPNCGAEMKGE